MIKMKRTEARSKINEVVQLSHRGLDLAGLNLTDEQRNNLEKNVRDLSNEYVKSAYELYDC